MISGATEQELEIANARAELLLEIKEKDKEIERLNNIINELEKYFDKELENLGYREEKLYTQGIHDTIIDHKYKLQELKGDSSNE